VRAKIVDEFETSLVDPKGTQERRFHSIMDRCRGSKFGSEHNLDKIRTLSDFRSAVPIRSHSDFLPYLDRVAQGDQGVLTQDSVSMLLETSGTTGIPKHLPVTTPWAERVGAAQALWMLGLIRDHEPLARGKALSIVSLDTERKSIGGLAIGSNTGRMLQAQPWWIRLRSPVPISVFGLGPLDVRQYVILRFALGVSLTSITTANPSTLLLYARRLREWADDLGRDLADGTLRHGPAAALPASVRRKLEFRLRRCRVPDSFELSQLWPLSVVNCWKSGPAAFFARRLEAMLGPSVPVREVGVTASEGYFAIPVLPGGEGGSALWTCGHLLEFVGRDNQPRWAWELEPGEVVRLVVSTTAGLLRYDLDDLVEVVGKVGETPLVRFVGKGGRYLNVVGERVTEAQVAQAMVQASERHLVGFTVRSVLEEVPYYELGIEPYVPNANAGIEASEWASVLKEFDKALCQENVEYAGRRKSGRLGPPQMRQLAPGTYRCYRMARAEMGAPDSQIKDPIMALNAGEWDAVLRANQSAGVA